MRSILAVAVAGGLAAVARPAAADPAENEAAKADSVVNPQPIPADLRDAIPEQGIYIAGVTRHSTNQVDEDFYIALLDRDGLHQLAREHPDFIQARAGQGLAWIDGTTLITDDFRGSTEISAAYSIYRMTGRSASKPEHVEVPVTDWKLGKHDHVAEDDWGPELLVTGSGEAWLAQCLKKDHDSQCVRTRYLRIYGGARLATSRRPKGLVATRGGARLPELKTAPAGYRVKVAYGTCTCSGPAGKHVTPDDDADRDPSFPFHPRRVHWVLAKPPLYEVSGDMQTPVDTTEYTSEVWWACKDSSIKDFVLVRPRLWGDDTEVQHAGGQLFHDETRLWIDDTAIGTVAGEPDEIAFSR